MIWQMIFINMIRRERNGENCSTSSILQRGFENGYDSILTVWIGFYPTILNGLISMINTDFIF